MQTAQVPVRGTLHPVGWLPAEIHLAIVHWRLFFCVSGQLTAAGKRTEAGLAGDQVKALMDWRVIAATGEVCGAF